MLKSDAENLFEGLVEQSLTGIYVIQGGRFVYVNPKFGEIFGYATEEIRALLSFSELVAPEDRELVAENLRRRLAGEIHDLRYSFRGQRKDGGRIDVEIHGAATEMGGRTAVIGTLIDITDQRAAEAALRASESRFRAVFHSAPIGVALLSLDARYLAINPAFEAMLGYPAAELIGRHEWEHYPDRSSTEPLAHLESLLSGARGSYRREQRFVRRDGREIHAQVTASLMRCEAGTPQFGICMVEDITERKQLEGQLRQAQKMEAVGRFAGGIAHDFNNTLAAIGAYAQILFDDLEECDPRRADAQEILKAASRAGGLTRQLLTFSRKKVVEYQLLDLRAVVADFEPLLRPLLPAAITLVTRSTNELVQVHGDRTQIEQVLMNLALNARDAMPEGGTLEIAVSLGSVPRGIQRAAARASAPGAPCGAKAQAGDLHAVLTVCDTGIGMTDEVRARLFEPFFTTKAAGQGTGLGLATVYAIAQQVGGATTVDSRPGKGACFTVYLPLASGPAPAPPAPAPVQARAAAGDLTTTVLLAEDEPSVRDAARRLLERAGFRVIATSDGHEALEQLTADPDAIDVLLTDVMMPGMGGVELIQRGVALVPSLPVVLMSGYADIPSTNPRAMCDAVLEKPFSADALVSTVRAAARARQS